jgi:hypothetical protein
MRLRSACLVGLLLVSACGRKEQRNVRSGPMAPPEFWVWHRSSPLTADERESLGKTPLYWQAAECEWGKAAWRVNRISPPMKDAEIIPVFRIKPQPAFLGAPDSAKALAGEIRKWSDGSLPPEIQIDFDCPDRLLGDYADFLETLGKEISPTRISITALASWPRYPDFMKLAESVCSLAPMFYDLKPDNPADVKSGRFQPMADPSVTELIRLWSKCPRPRLVGLPNFERMSVFEANGKLTGHLRGWEHDAVFFHPDLKLHALGAGVTLFETTADVEVSGTTIPPGGKLVHRMPDTTELESLEKAADQAGASGVIYFALPGPGIQAAFTPTHLAHVSEAPQPVLELGERGTVILKNPGPRDLPARVWELELHSDIAGAFRSASPGGFATMDGISGTVILRFAKLRAGESIVSGPLVANADGLVWSIRGIAGKQAPLPKDSAR